MNPLSEIALGLAVALAPVLTLGALLWLNSRIRRRQAARIRRQIALTDAIHSELGAAAAPEVRQSWLGGWTVSAAVPFHQEATVGAVVRIASNFFSKLDPMAPTKLRIVLTPVRGRPGRQPATSSITGPDEKLSRAA